MMLFTMHYVHCRLFLFHSLESPERKRRRRKRSEGAVGEPELAELKFKFELTLPAEFDIEKPLIEEILGKIAEQNDWGDFTLTDFTVAGEQTFL